ncbi:MAG: hypothetical protein AAFQ37_08345 [Bacteroidota bacterium]
MRNSKLPFTEWQTAFILAVTTIIFFACEPAVEEAAEAASPDLSNYQLDDANVLAFGPDQVLFVGDSKAGIVHAISTTATELKDAVPYGTAALDKKIASEINVPAEDLVIQDMKIHPLSQEAYVAVKTGLDPSAKSIIAIVTPGSGEVRFLDVEQASHTQVALSNPVSTDYNFWRDIPASSLTITDIDYNDGYVYVAGLTNGEFASNLRKIAYPFGPEQATVGSIEMYHPVHTQKETRAPIRTMAFEEINGESILIASYTCTPLVTIPTSAIQDGNHIKAKTVAELGFGNAPIDMITFMAQEMDGSYDKKLLITHKNRSGSLISLKDLATANQGDGLAGVTTMGPAGVNIFPVPTSGIMQLDEQNQMMLAVLRRNIDNGGVDLISELKGSYFRLSDFIAEYNFPDYKYPAEQEPTKQFHDMVKPMEGYPELTSNNMN